MQRNATQRKARQRKQTDSHLSSLLLMISFIYTHHSHPLTFSSPFSLSDILIRNTTSIQCIEVVFCMRMVTLTHTTFDAVTVETQSKSLLLIKQTTKVISLVLP